MDTSFADMPPSTTIVGAGLAGLTLARSLLHHRLPYVLYEKSPKRSPSSSARFNYGITLHKTTYTPLLPILGIDEATFRRTVAVLPDSKQQDGELRVNRSKLETLLKEGLDIKWDGRVVSKTGSTLELKDSSEVSVPEGSIVVAADGVHSALRPSSLKPSVLPYIAINGKRRNLPADLLGDDTVLVQQVGDIRLEISLNEPGSISYTFSRPAEEGDESKAYNLGRANAEATTIPDAFYDELDELQLDGVWKEVFSVEKLKKDRLLHWLMRSLVVPESDRRSLEEEAGVVLLGDAAGVAPILGSEGANVGMREAMGLAGWIKGGRKSLWAVGKAERSRRVVEEGVERLKEIHKNGGEKGSVL